MAKVGGKGLFVKELEQALLEGTADLAVHSMKDVPGVLPAGLEISVVTPRESPFDAFVSLKYRTIQDLPQGAIVGTSSLRRAAQLKYHRPDLVIRSIRGNVETRLRKIEEGQYDATILATAGLKRLGLDDKISERLPVSLMIPAVAQGVVGIETRQGDQQTLQWLHPLHDDSTAACILAERTLLQVLEGNCQIPLAGYCTLEGTQLNLTAMVAHPEGTALIRHQATASKKDGEKLGQSVADYLLRHGAKEILTSL